MAFLQPLRLLIYAGTYLGQPLAIVSLASGTALGMGAIAATAILAVHFLVAGRSVPEAHAVLLGLALFSAGTALMTGLGRLEFTNLQALSPRYATTALLFWLALFGIALCAASRAKPERRRLAFAALGSAVVLALSLLVVMHFRQSRETRLIATDARISRLALLVGIADDDALKRLYVPSRSHVIEEAAFLRRESIGPFRESLASWIGRRAGDLFPSAPAGRCIGAVDEMVTWPPVPPVPGTETGRRTGGWLADRHSERTPSTVLFVDSDGVIVGFVETLEARPPIVETFFGRRGRTAKWRGFAQSVADDAYGVYALTADRHLCRLNA